MNQQIDKNSSEKREKNTTNNLISFEEVEIKRRDAKLLAEYQATLMRLVGLASMIEEAVDLEVHGLSCTLNDFDVFVNGKLFEGACLCGYDFLNKKHYVVALQEGRVEFKVRNKK